MSSTAETSKIEQLKSEAEKQIRNHWEEKKRPILLSQLGLSLRSAGFKYEEITNGLALAVFLKANGDKFSVVSNPAKPLQVGVLPAGQSYEFPESSGPGTASTDGKNDSYVPVSAEIRRSRGALYSFISELSKLPKDEVEGVKIPVSVLIRLMEGE